VVARAAPRPAGDVFSFSFLFFLPGRRSQQKCSETLVELIQKRNDPIISALIKRGGWWARPSPCRIYTKSKHQTTPKDPCYLKNRGFAPGGPNMAVVLHFQKVAAAAP